MRGFSGENHDRMPEQGEDALIRLERTPRGANCRKLCLHLRSQDDFHTL